MALVWDSLRVGMVETNCYLAKDTVTGKGAIIDPGDQVKMIQAKIEKMGMEPEAILLTHGHFDHILAVEPLKERYPGIRVYIHPEDHKMDPSFGFKAPEVTDLYNDGDVVKVGELEFKVIHTPGHTKGGVTLQCENVLFTGDTLFKNSMGRTDFPGGSEPVLLASLLRLYELPGDYQVCPGHEACSTLEWERKHNYCIRYALDHR